MTQTLGPEQLTATLESSLEDTPFPIKQTLSQSALDQCVALTLHEEEIDKYTTHKALMSDIDEIIKFQGAISPERISHLRENIRANAIDLAAQILPEDMRAAYGLKASIPDSEGYLHPPKRNEVLLLGEAWDVTGDETVGAALEAAIDELTNDKDSYMLRQVLIESSQSGINFTTTYRRLQHELSQVDTDIDQPTPPKVYMAYGDNDHGNHVARGNILYTINSVQDPLDEANEVYIGTKVAPASFEQPIFDSAIGDFVNDSTPRVLVPPHSPVTEL